MSLPLREAIQEKHLIAEKMPFNQRMFQGLLSKAEYHHYLVQQLAIFQEFEKRTLPAASLARVPALVHDIQELVAQGYQDKQLLESTQQYVDYLASLSDEQIMPHIYLHYMAILFGGQLMKSKVPSQGHYYEFDNKAEAIASIRAIQKDSWADEVNRGFDFTIAQLDELNSYHKTIA